MNGLKPELSTSTPGAGTDLLTIERAREVVGLYEADLAEDAPIATLINAAAAYISRLTTRPCVTSAHVDQFRRWHNRLELKAAGGTINMLRVSYYGEDNTLAVLADTSYFLDPTAQPAAVLMTDAALAAAPALSARIANPVQISYHLNPLIGAETQLVAEAISMVFKSLWEVQVTGVDRPDGVGIPTRMAAMNLLRPWMGPRL